MTGPFVGVDAADLRLRLATPRRADDPLDARLAVPARSDDAADLVEAATPVPAAVLVPIILGPTPGVLLTKRTERLRRHAGQVSFPGGRIDPGDRDATGAALREAQEEIGLAPAQVEVVGTLPDYVTGTGYLVSPIVGLVPPSLTYTPAPDEVEAVFELPMDVLLDPAAPQRRRAQYRGRWREFWVWPHPDFYIWGATAAILLHLARVLRADDG